MRSSSLSDCWPFGGDARLPPMPVRKFRWWGDEVIHSQPPPIASSSPVRLLPSDSLDEGDDEEEDSRSGKHRSPKKRSIVELFAVIPPVNTSKEEEKQPRRGRGKDILLRAFLNRNKKNGKFAGRERRCRRKKRKKVEEISILAPPAIQETMCGNDVPLAVEMPQLFKCSAKKKLMRSRRPSIDGKKINFTRQGLTKKHRHDQTSKLMPKNFKRSAKVLPLHSILKNHSRGLSVKKIAVNGSMDRAVKKTFRQSVKHVHFACEDAILGQKKNNSRVELSQLQSTHKELSNVLAAPSTFNDPNKSDNVSIAINSAQVEKGSGSTVKKRTGLPADYQHTNVVSNNHGVLNHEKGSCIHTKDNSFISSVDLNRGLQNEDNSDCIEISDNHQQSTISDQIATDEECLHFALQIHGDQRPSIVSDVGTIPLVGNFLPSSCFMHVEGSEMLPHALISPTLGSCGCSSASLHLGIPLSNEEARLQMDLYNLGNAIMLKDSISLRSDRNMDTNFLALPLNSHAEPAQNSNKISLSKGIEQHSAILCHDNDSPAPASEHRGNINDTKMKETFSGVGVFKDDRISQVSDIHCPGNGQLTYSSGYIALQDGTISPNQGLVKNKVSLLHQSHDVNKLPFKRYKESDGLHQCICRVNDRPQAEHMENNSPSVQPTVRLMGKNLTVGRNNIDCEVHRDSTLCTDKEIVNVDQYTGRVFSSKTLSESSAEKECPPLMHIMPTENFTQFLVTPDSFFPEKEGRGRQTTESHIVSRDGNPLPVGKSVAPMDALNNSFSAHAMLNKTVQPSNKPMVASEYVRSVQQVPLDFPRQDAHQPMFQHMLRISAPCNHSESTSGSKISNFDPSFLNLGYGNFGQPSLAASSSNDPSWFLNASGPTSNNPCYMSNFQQFPVRSKCDVSRANVFVQPSPGMLVASFPARPDTSPGYSVPSSFLKTSVIPSLSVNSSVFAAKTLENEGYRRDGVIHSIPQFKGSELCGKSKGVSIKDDVLIRQVKKPPLRMQNDQHSPACQLETQYSHGCRKLEIRRAKFHPSGSNRSDLRSPVNFVKDDPRSKVRSGNMKQDCVAGSGPFKLSGGTKHILMPSPTSGENNSRPMHSIVRVDAGNSASKKAIPEKAAKIYSF